MEPQFTEVISFLMKKWYMTGIYLDYAGCIPVLFQFWFDRLITTREMMNMQPRLRTRMYTSLLRRGTSHHPSKSMFSSATIFSRYIYLVYTCHILHQKLKIAISHQQISLLRRAQEQV